MNWRAPVSALLLAAAVGCAPTEPSDSLAGTWDMIGFSADGQTAQSITGTATFDDNGTVVFDGMLTYAGTSPNPVDNNGQWTQSGNSLTMVIAGSSSEWALTFSGNQVVLQQLEDQSASRLTLRRQ